MCLDQEWPVRASPVGCAAFMYRPSCPATTGRRLKSGSQIPARQPCHLRACLPPAYRLPPTGRLPPVYRLPPAYRLPPVCRLPPQSGHVRDRELLISIGATGSRCNGTRTGLDWDIGMARGGAGHTIPPTSGAAGCCVPWSEGRTWVNCRDEQEGAEMVRNARGPGRAGTRYLRIGTSGGRAANAQAGCSDRGWILRCQWRI